MELTGKEAEKLLEEAGITVNKNTIPYDPESPFVTSGIRMGTAALTTRGMKQEEMVKIAKVIAACSEEQRGRRSSRKSKRNNESHLSGISVIQTTSNCIRRGKSNGISKLF